MITGGSRGIGLAIVERLSNEGACIAILDKNEESDHTTSLHLLDRITDDWKRKRIQNSTS